MFTRTPTIGNFTFTLMLLVMLPAGLLIVTGAFIIGELSWAERLASLFLGSIPLGLVFAAHHDRRQCRAPRPTPPGKVEASSPQPEIRRRRS